MRRFAAGRDAPGRGAAGDTVNGGVDFERGGELAGEEREVTLGDGAALELEAETATAGAGLGDEEEAAGFAIEAVGEGGAPVAEAIGEEPVGEGARAFARGGVDEDAGGFVEDEEMSVFEEDFQGARFGENHGLRGFGEVEQEAILREEGGAGIDLDGGAREELEAPGEDGFAESLTAELGGGLFEEGEQASGLFDRERKGG